MSTHPVARKNDRHLGKRISLERWLDLLWSVAATLAFGIGSPAWSASPVLESTIVLPLRIHLPVLAKRLDAEVPRQLANLDQDGVVCVPAKYLNTKAGPELSKCKRGGSKISCPSKWLEAKVSPDIKCDLRGWVKRSEPLQLTGNGDTSLRSPIERPA